MKRNQFSLLLAGFMTAAFAQQDMQPPWAKSPKIEIKGTIERVHVAPGQGMPYLELKNDRGVHRVMLGSMRYLMEHDFNPKAGSIAIVKGFLYNELVVAQSVAIPGEKKSITLRDDKGLPLWRQGRHGWK